MTGRYWACEQLTEPGHFETQQTLRVLHQSLCGTTHSDNRTSRCSRRTLSTPRHRTDSLPLRPDPSLRFRLLLRFHEINARARTGLPVWRFAAAKRHTGKPVRATAGSGCSALFGDRFSAVTPIAGTSSLMSNGNYNYLVFGDSENECIWIRLE